MSLQEDLVKTATPKLEELGDTLLSQFLGSWKQYVDESQDPKIREALEEAKNFKIKAMTATDANTAREYAKGVEVCLQRARTLAAGEAVAASEEAAAMFAAGFAAVLNTLAEVGKGLILTVGEALVAGTIKGLTGGTGFDPSGVFPHV